MNEPTPTLASVRAALCARFPEAEHRQRPGKGGKQFTYVDARAVQDRLDEVVGPEFWEVHYEVADVTQGAVKCRLTILGTQKEDFGYPNNGEDSDEPLKQAASDGLKRAACQFGIGRYLWQVGKPGQQQHAAVSPRADRALATAPVRPAEPTLRERAMEPVSDAPVLLGPKAIASLETLAMRKGVYLPDLCAMAEAMFGTRILANLTREQGADMHAKLTAVADATPRPAQPNLAPAEVR